MSADTGAASPITAKTLDTLIFGDTKDESSHSFSAGFFAPQATVDPIPTELSASVASDVVAGQFGLKGRRMLPRTPNPDYYGGELSFKMAVDPARVNHFTIKTFGSDPSSSWMVLNVEGLEVGWRHDYLATDEMILHQDNGWYNGAFVYRTVRLPFHLTRGKSTVTIRLRSIGTINYYAGGIYDQYQSRMKAPTVPVYAAYTHTGAQLDISGERQGTLIGGPARAAESGTTAVDKWKTDANSLITRLLASSVTDLSNDNVQLLAQSYDVAWSTGYQNPAVLTSVRDSFDAMVKAYAGSPTTYFDGFGTNGWGGYLGPVGEAARLLAVRLAADLDAQVDYGGSIGVTTRRSAWAAALRASVDYGRVHRLTVSNQAMWVAWRIYLGNRALLTLEPGSALKESEAKRYLHEAAGISPWLGNDKAGGGDTPVRGDPPYGPNWFMTTSDGTTKEDCLVGGDYGEQGSEIMQWAVSTNDAALKAQAIKMLRARAALRYPALDEKGRKTFIVTEPIGCRNPYEIGWHIAYLGRGTVSDLLVASLGPEVVGRDLVGYVQQAVADGQFMSRMTVSSNMMGWTEGLRMPDLYAKFASLGPTGVNLPMGSDQPDFAWADRDNMAIAAKHGEERFWAVLNWRGAIAMNRLARVFVTKPSAAFTGDVEIDDVQYTPAGSNYLATAKVEGYDPLTPPDNPVNANNGQFFPVAMRPDLSTPPVNSRDGGRADAYTLRYGRWLVALNAHPSRSYSPKLPAGFKSAVDLASGKTYSGTVTLAPRSYAVFYFDATTPVTLDAGNPLSVVALGGNESAKLSWAASAGATSYSVARSNSPDGPFTVIAKDLTTTSFTDTSVAAGKYYYKVIAHAVAGDSGSASPPTAVTVAAAALPAPWLASDIGAVGTPGSSKFANGIFTIQASGWDISQRADSFHAALAPVMGDAVLTARVLSQQNVNGWAKAGVMFRQSLSASSAFAGVFVTPSNGIQFVTRASDGVTALVAGTLKGAENGAGSWVRLARSGDTFTAFTSIDGRQWTKVGIVSLKNSPSLLYAAIASDSNKDPELSTTTLDQVVLAQP
ncbi:hypothetical protein EJP67_29770 [Variovorax guangxiensis]|uniref:Fibronectin type-III domain-containing protein n=1 Tax=Variovorax guangxiensis TaxID=1775474 RepID=A0A433MTU1_9BURK|nr:hypothetical protein [Variovorax guangxiensis]RUR71240.1 hypothetical protein EJP67_29770 [Variovorax guangxiensis]